MQHTLFADYEIATRNVFPSTRYQGSKAKFAEWIWHEISRIDFHTALDAFGGTGSIAYKLKDNGKAVVYNDILPFNAVIGKALIENSHTVLDNDDIDAIIRERPGFSYPTFIYDHFHDIYYTDEENHWLDVVRYNIAHLADEYKQALAWFALFQACIIKRPYNLFHRKNLYVRTSDVERTFGNKTTWDTPFATHFRNFAEEANNAVFDNGERCISMNCDAIEMPDVFDLVYVDTPYINAKGVGVDYADFYHFLNGLLDYDNWADRIDYRSQHLRLMRQHSVWNDKNAIYSGFKTLFDHFCNSVLVISYRSNGIPSIDELLNMLSACGRHSSVRHSNEIKYALSDTKSKESLIISYPNHR